MFKDKKNSDDERRGLEEMKTELETMPPESAQPVVEEPPQTIEPQTPDTIKVEPGKTADKSEQPKADVPDMPPVTVEVEPSKSEQPKTEEEKKQVVLEAREGAIITFLFDVEGFEKRQRAALKKEQEAIESITDEERKKAKAKRIEYLEKDVKDAEQASNALSGDRNIKPSIKLAIELVEARILDLQKPENVFAGVDKNVLNYIRRTIEGATKKTDSGVPILEVGEADIFKNYLSAAREKIKDNQKEAKTKDKIEELKARIEELENKLTALPKSEPHPDTPPASEKDKKAEPAPDVKPDTEFVIEPIIATAEYLSEQVEKKVVAGPDDTVSLELTDTQGIIEVPSKLPKEFKLTEESENYIRDIIGRKKEELDFSIIEGKQKALRLLLDADEEFRQEFDILYKEVQAGRKTKQDLEQKRQEYRKFALIEKELAESIAQKNIKAEAEEKYKSRTTPPPLEKERIEQEKRQFVGRTMREIIKETAGKPTDFEVLQKQVFNLSELIEKAKNLRQEIKESKQKVDVRGPVGQYLNIKEKEEQFKDLSAKIIKLAGKMYDADLQTEAAKKTGFEYGTTKEQYVAKNIADIERIYYEGRLKESKKGSEEKITDEDVRLCSEHLKQITGNQSINEKDVLALLGQGYSLEKLNGAKHTNNWLKDVVVFSGDTMRRKEFVSFLDALIKQGRKFDDENIEQRTRMTKYRLEREWDGKYKEFKNYLTDAVFTVYRMKAEMYNIAVFQLEKADMAVRERAGKNRKKRKIKKPKKIIIKRKKGEISIKKK